MDSIINTFHLDLKTIIAQMINFGIVFTVLYIYAIKPLGKIMKERSEKIEKGIDDAKSNADILNKTKDEYEKVLTKARMEADKIFQEGKKEAEAKKILMLEKVKDEVAVMIESGKKTLESEKIKMLSETKGEITSLAIKIAEKLIAGKVDGSFDEKTVEEIKNL